VSSESGQTKLQIRLPVHKLARPRSLSTKGICKFCTLCTLCTPQSYSSRQPNSSLGTTTAATMASPDDNECSASPPSGCADACCSETVATEPPAVENDGCCGATHGAEHAHQTPAKAACCSDLPGTGCCGDVGSTGAAGCDGKPIWQLSFHSRLLMCAPG